MNDPKPDSSSPRAAQPQSPHNDGPHRVHPFWAVLASLAVVACAVTLLRGLGRTWWCVCGSPRWWVADIWSAHNSQHLLDPYTFSHIQHGILFFAVLALLVPKWSCWSRLVAAIAIESAWEVLENTSWIIEKYRGSTVSLDYFGDSVVNSVGDIAACAAGFGLAAVLPVWSSATACAAIELVMLVWIRDSLLLNVLMLVHPFDTIKTWQMGG